MLLVAPSLLKAARPAHPVHPQYRPFRPFRPTASLSLFPSKDDSSATTIQPHPSPLPQLPQLPPAALSWSLTASLAAAISYADRGTSAIAASSLLEELKWTEGELGNVQSAFFWGYGLTQVLGGVLSGSTSSDTDSELLREGTSNGSSGSANNEDAKRRRKRTQGGNYRTILPLSLLLTGITTLLFPLAAIHGGPTMASFDRFVLGLLEGVLLPAAMAGVGATTTADINDNIKINNSNNNNKATASAIVIAGCYLGSAWAYLSAWGLFSESFQKNWIQFLSLLNGVVRSGGIGGIGGIGDATILGKNIGDATTTLLTQPTTITIWPWVFYVNGLLSMVILVVCREEFDLSWCFKTTSENEKTRTTTTEAETSITKKIKRGKEARASTTITLSSAKSTNANSIINNIWKDTIRVAKETLASKSGRAILAAQIGQGALLYTIASWGPLYLERVVGIGGDGGDVDLVSTKNVSDDDVPPPSASSSLGTSGLSSVAIAASTAASSLILPQLTQAFVGVTIGATADQASNRWGAQITRRTLQILSGVGPAIVLWFLTLHDTSSTDDNIGVAGDDHGLSNNNIIASPPALFGAAQTISALSLGAVSVSHLDIATPSTAGAVYALGNVAAALSGSLMVNLFGRWLEEETGRGSTFMADDGGSVGQNVGDGREFDLPFRVVALLSGMGSLWYGFTVETDLEIGVNGTKVDDEIII